MIRTGLFTLLAAGLVLVLSGQGSGRLLPATDSFRGEDESADPEMTGPAPVRTVAPGADQAGLLRPSLYPLHLRPLPGETAARPRSGGRRELVLTFDDGPDLLGTPVVLKELERRGLKAIFFVNGQHMVGSRPQDLARRDLIRKIAAQGHLVANHGLSHRNVCADPETLEHEIDGNAEIIAAATGVRPLLFRAPYGARCRRLDEALRAREVLQVGWNLDPQEWKPLAGAPSRRHPTAEGEPEDAVVSYVTGRLARFGGRAILLLHDTKREAVRALPRILDWIEKENDRLVAAGEPPIRVRDYSVFLPPVPLPDTGLEPVLEPIALPIFTELRRTLGVFADRRDDRPARVRAR